MKRSTKNWLKKNEENNAKAVSQSLKSCLDSYENYLEGAGAVDGIKKIVSSNTPNVTAFWYMLNREVENDPDQFVQDAKDSDENSFSEYVASRLAGYHNGIADEGVLRGLARGFTGAIMIKHYDAASSETADMQSALSFDDMMENVPEIPSVDDAIELGDNQTRALQVAGGVCMVDASEELDNENLSDDDQASLTDSIFRDFVDGLSVHPATEGVESILSSLSSEDLEDVDDDLFEDFVSDMGDQLQNAESISDIFGQDDNQADWVTIGFAADVELEFGRDNLEDANKFAAFISKNYPEALRDYIENQTAFDDSVLQEAEDAMDDAVDED